MERHRPLVESLLIFAFVVSFFGLFSPPNQYFEQSQVVRYEESNAFSQVTHIALLVFLVAATIVQGRAFLRAALLAWPVFGLVGLAFLSAMWSSAPWVVVRHAGTLALSTMFACYVYARYSMPHLIRMLTLAFCLMAVCSFAIMIVEPGLGHGPVIGDPTAWRGAFITKNILGWSAALGTIVAVYALVQHHGWRPVAAATVVMSFALVVLSDSRGALLLGLFAAYVAVLLALLRSRTDFGLGASLFIAVLGFGLCFIIYLFSKEILLLLNRTPHLTGRDLIWQNVILSITKRPWLGYGYGAFWRSDSIEANRIWLAIGWSAPSAHNGWLELALNLGGIGVLYTAWLWMTSLYRAVRLTVVQDAEYVTFCVLILAAILQQNMSEATLLQTGAAWLLFVIAFLHLKHEALARLRGTAAAPWNDHASAPTAPWTAPIGVQRRGGL
jgi:O-antigen ligase